MEWNERVYGALLVAVLTVLAGFYALRQAAMLRRLRGPHGLSDEEARWRRGQAWRRLFGSALMVALAALLAWAVLGAGERAQGPVADTPEGHRFVQLYTAVWIVILVLLLVLVILAAVDIWFTRRFSLRQHRKILAERRAMLEREVARLRQERNGHE